MIAGLNMGSPAFLIFSLASMTVGIFTTVMSFVYNKHRYKVDVAEWKTDYLNYIDEKRAFIKKEQTEEVTLLNEVYPSTEISRKFIDNFSDRIYERSPEDNDFLHIRLGFGKIPAIRKPEFKNEEHIKIPNELAEIPEKIAKEFEKVDNQPITAHLREAGNIGVTGSESEIYEFLKVLVEEICVYHYHLDTEIILLIPPEKREQYAWVKWIPHIANSGSGARGIVCNDESRDVIFEYIYSVMTERLDDSERQDKVLTPHIVVLAIDEYGIKTHPLYKFADRADKLGVSFVYFKQEKDNLSHFCKEIIELNENSGVLRFRDDKAFESQFTREYIKDSTIGYIADRLAPVYCDSIALASRLTSNITLFQLLNIISPDNLNLTKRWENSNVTRSLAAPLGVDATGSVIYLDLHERAHGSHGLVAGTTGSGKSELLQSYILSVALCFHPYEVAFVLIDFKGGGMANQFSALPHLIGKITDIDNYEIERSLLSIRAEIDRRKRLFAENNVNRIDDYISGYKSGTIKTPMPHLILIVDEFAELKAEQPEFMKELISTSRIGRSLGVHLILATQKPAGQVSEQIWSNSRFKVCLKVATKEDSNEVLKSPLAFEIHEPGRAYLQVGNNEIFTLFQSAYSGASAQSDKNGNMREFSISEVSFEGKRTVVYEQKAQVSESGRKINQLEAITEYIADFCKNSGITSLPEICMPPLPDTVQFESTANTVSVGIYDDPVNQTQPQLTLGLQDKNYIIIGSAQTGKTMFVETIIRSLAENNSPEKVWVYILDFASKVLKQYESLPHIGGVMTDSNDEKIKHFFKMITTEIAERKELFSNAGISSYKSYIESNPSQKLPQIIIIIDNLIAFKDTYNNYEERLLSICREGTAFGITVIATAKQTSGLSYKYFSNFPGRIAFNCTESSEYSTIFDRCRRQPKNIPGRGLCSIDKKIYEFQGYMPFDGDSESKRSAQLAVFTSDMASKYPKQLAKKIPEIPAVLTPEYWHGTEFSDYTLPIGLTYEGIETVSINLEAVGSIGIYGREKSGKSNLLYLILDYLKNGIFSMPSEVFILDGYDRKFTEYASFGFINRITYDITELDEILEHIEETAEKRRELLKNGEGLADEPLLLLIISNKNIYQHGAVEKTTTDTLKKLLHLCKGLKITFIFSNIDNNGETSPPDIMRLARDLSQYFFFDDMANVKALGNTKFNPNDVKPFTKPIISGEGYTYNSRNGIEKIKLAKRGRK
jgi:S-DNA-T family DNA segregation ATPase FtsK/SpoIIIE